jgi:glyoxylase-like metal-dependent hydrolase (beta-lactamase superfamily II)
MMEIAPGIYQLKAPFFEFKEGCINAYLIRGIHGWLMVDTGWNSPEAFEALTNQLDEIGLSFKNISHIVFTHFHPDHYGLAGKLKDLSGAKLAMHQIERDLIDSRYINMEELLDEIARLFHINGVPEEESSQLQKVSLPVRQFVLPAVPEIGFKGGERFSFGEFIFEVIWTPGHSPGHICLYEPERHLLISGDHILPITTPNISLHPQSGENPLGDYLKSLNSMKQLKVDLILPGHEHIFHNLSSRIEEIIGHHQRREADIKDALEAGEQTAYQIAVKIPWMNDLRLMEIEGRITRHSQNGIDFYQLT